ncbi:MAG: hypothetical protein ACLFPI_01120 [Desulfobacterales bacterium]
MIYYIDMFLISFYRAFATPIIGYLFGTFCLCLLCVLVGRATYGLLSLWNHQWLETHHREMIRMHNLSLKALSFKNKNAYKACNKEANEAFGRFFFSRMAMGMSMLWPVPFALAWMDLRFAAVTFPVWGTGHSIGYLATFIPLFLLVNILFAAVKRKIRVVSADRRGEDRPTEEMMTLADLVPEPVTRK